MQQMIHFDAMFTDRSIAALLVYVIDKTSMPQISGFFSPKYGLSQDDTMSHIESHA